jgi:nitrite reductase/ring-hydroxylating ferredoxin subunit
VVRVEVAALDQLEEGVAVVVAAGRREIMVVRWQGEIYAVRNVCPHMSVPFSVINRVVERGAQTVHAGMCGGSPFGELERIDEAVITCPWHGWSFSLADGTCAVDRRLRVKTYPTVIEGNTVYLEMPA